MEVQEPPHGNPTLDVTLEVQTWISILRTLWPLPLELNPIDLLILI